MQPIFTWQEGMLYSHHSMFSHESAGTAWLCRSRVKFAHQTHYVGDLRYMCSSISTYTVTMLINIKLLCRAVNAQQIDTYQLKSLDGQFGE